MPVPNLPVRKHPVEGPSVQPSTAVLIVKSYTETFQEIKGGVVSLARIANIVREEGGNGCHLTIEGNARLAGTRGTGNR